MASNQSTLNRDQKTGLFWPPQDYNAQNWVVGDSEDIPLMVDIVEKYRPHLLHEDYKSVMIEAGGHVGYWTRKFLDYFDVIYTFEPDPVNFLCLTHNVPEGNVIKFNAALGYDRYMNVMSQNEIANSGSKQVKKDTSGNIPTLRLDDLTLPHLDFIQFDLEGYEFPALLGAENTIKNCRPIISVEMKGHDQKYGYTDGSILAFMNNLNYRLETVIRSDSIFVSN